MSEDETTPVVSTPGPTLPGPHDGCKACHPPESARHWGQVITYWSNRQAIVIATAEHQMQVSVDVMEMMVKIARGLCGPNAQIRMDALDLAGHLHMYAFAPREE